MKINFNKNKSETKSFFKKILLFSFALSGFTSLIYEVIWLKPLQLVFGSTIYAVSSMLTTLMIGFALGSFFFRNIADRTKNPIFIFALLQLGIGLYGMLILSLFKVLPTIYLNLIFIPGFQFLQFILAFFVLIWPAILFGAIWPIMNKAYVDLNRAGKDIGKLYFFNSFGSLIGSLSAGFLFIPTLGIQNTSLLVASLNIFLAVFIFFQKNEN